MLDYLKHDVDITELSNFKTKAFSKFYYEINSEDDLKLLSTIYDFTEHNKIGFLIIGGGTNLLFAFDKFNGVIIKNNLNGFKYLQKSCLLKAFSNTLVSNIAEELENDLNQDIWHRFIGLPGSIGGAVFGNAGCFGLETENNFLEAKVLNLENGEILSFNKFDSDFGYRNSKYKKNEKYFIISIIFDLSRKIEKYHSDVDNIDFRENRQPKGNSCGSFFKNPNNNSAGKLIEEVGMKGYRLKSAYFSELHSNFLMSDSNGDYRDLIELMKLVQVKVKDEFNILLENEVRIITN